MCGRVAVRRGMRHFRGLAMECLFLELFHGINQRTEGGTEQTEALRRQGAQDQETHRSPSWLC